MRQRRSDERLSEESSGRFPSNPRPVSDVPGRTSQCVPAFFCPDEGGSRGNFGRAPPRSKNRRPEPASSRQLKGHFGARQARTRGQVQARSGSRRRSSARGAREKTRTGKASSLHQARSQVGRGPARAERFQQSSVISRRQPGSVNWTRDLFAPVNQASRRPRQYLCCPGIVRTGSRSSGPRAASPDGVQIHRIRTGRGPCRGS